MKSKPSCFSRTIFFNQLKRFWPLYASYLVIWLLLVPLPLSSSLRTAQMNGWDLLENAMSHIVSTGFYGGLLMTAIFSAFFVMAAFFYLYNSRSVSQMGALPIKRGGVFHSVYLPGLIVMLVTHLVVYLMALAIASFYGLSVSLYAFQAIAMSSLMALFFYGFASFCAMLTGHALVLPLVYSVLNFAAAGVAGFAYVIQEKFLYGFSMASSNDPLLFVFSPVIYILGMSNLNPVYKDALGGDYTTIGYSYDSWGYLIAIAVAGLAFTALAVLLLRRRRMEAAGDVVAVKPLKPVFKYCMTFGCALIAGIGLFYLIYPDRYYTSAGGIEDAVIVLIFMLIGAFIGYFAAEMMIHKTFKVFSGKKWRGLAAVALILVAFTAVSEFDLLGFERRLPDASQVESVSVYGFGPMNFITDTDDIQTVIDIHQSLVEHKAQHESGGYTSYHPNFYIDYSMKDGSLIRRRYYLNTDVKEDLTAVLEFLNSPEMIVLRGTPNVPVSVNNISDASVEFYSKEFGYSMGEAISPADAYELYTECIVPDMKDGTIGQVDMGWLGEDYGIEFMDCNVYIYFFERAANGEYLNGGSLSFTPTGKSVRTNQWLLDHGFEVNPNTETRYYQ